MHHRTSYPKLIEHELGNIRHVLKQNDSCFKGFGEAYFSDIVGGAVKGWTFHQIATCNLVVCFGAVRFVVVEESKSEDIPTYFHEYLLDANTRYQRLTIPPRCWFAFQGIDSDISRVLNISDVCHDPEELCKRELSYFSYRWS